MDFREVIETRRSVRSFKPDPIDEEVLKRVLEAARIAPSGSNRQPWKFIIVTDPRTKQELVPLCEGQEFVGQAPAVIIACGFNIHYDRGHYMGDYSMLVDVAIAFDHLTLAARNEGIGTCWIGSFDNDGIKKLLDIPEDVQVVALTPLGYPKSGDVFAPVSNRKSLEEIISYQKWN